MICRDEKLPLIVAIDLQPMAPIEGVIQVQGDITNARTAEVVCTEVLPSILLTDVMFFPPFRNTI
jgi:23S rRNA U2552 (ribose-2'-O)-methylase RlmE/FtsJ